MTGEATSGRIWWSGIAPRPGPRVSAASALQSGFLGRSGELRRFAPTPHDYGWLFESYVSSTTS